MIQATFTSIAILLFAVQSATNQDVSEGKDAKSEKDEIVCKSTFVLGSKIPQRVCMRKSEWEDRQRDQRENYRGGRNGSSSCRDSGPC